MMITRDDVIKLLQLAAGYDNRTISAANIEAWAASADYARWTFEEAVQAIRAYYAETGGKPWATPGDVTTRVKAARKVELDRYRPELEAAPPASEEHRERVMAEVRKLARSFTIPAGMERVPRPRPASVDHAERLAAARAELDGIRDQAAQAGEAGEVDG